MIIHIPLLEYNDYLYFISIIEAPFNIIHYQLHFVIMSEDDLNTI
jgi:hypothetical protein